MKISKSDSVVRGLAGVAFFCASISMLLIDSANGAPNAYVRAQIGEPWRLPGNTLTMNAAFGASQVDSLFYESVVPANLFSLTREFIYMTGSDDNTNAMNSFIATNQVDMENWVAAGGRLVITAGSNQLNSFNLGFGASVISAGFEDGIVSDASHPIFDGTGLTDGQTVDGDAFHHNAVSGPGFTTLMTSSIGGLPILIERSWGDGHVILGTLTDAFFRSHPLWSQPESRIIHENLLRYGAGLPTIPEPSALLLALSAIGMLSSKRRR